MARVTARDVAEALGKGRERSLGPNRGWNTFCPAHDDRNSPSLSVSDGRDGKLLVHCHAGCKNDDVIDRLRDMSLWNSGKTRNWVAQKYAPEGKRDYDGFEHPKLGKPKRWWRYQDSSGRTRGFAVRFESTSADGTKTVKEIIPVSWCRDQESGEERWWWKAMPAPRPLYRERELSEARSKHVLLVEGEKAADAAQKLVGDTYVVTTWPGGSKAVKKTDWSALRGRDVTIWPDADSPGDKAAREIAEILLSEEAQAKVVRRVDLPESLPVGWDLADEIPEYLDVVKSLHDAKQYTPLGDEVVERFNRRHALALIGGQAVVLEEGYDPANGIPKLNYLSVGGFKEFYGNKQVITGKTQVPESTYWLRHEARRSYKGVTFNPGAEPNGYYNLWRGFTVEPDPTGEWSTLRDHMLKNVCQGDEERFNWVFAWFAQMAQYPEIKPGTSLSLRGKQGTGKTILGKVFGQLWRPHYVLVDKPHYVTGQFNAHMASCLLLHADEAFFAGNPSNAGMLRGMVTSDTLRVEQKGRDSIELPNFMRLLVSSNHSWVIPAGFEERRFAVLDVGEGRMQDRAYFQEMLRELEDGGYAALLHDLLNFDLTTVDVGTIPVTEALQEQKLHSLDTTTRYWFERLWDAEAHPGEGEWPAHAIIQDLHEDYVKVCVSWGEPRRLDQHAFARELKKFWPRPWETARVRRPRADPRKTARPWAVVLGTLAEHRKKFQEVLGGPVEWDERDPSLALAGKKSAPEYEVPF